MPIIRHPDVRRMLIWMKAHVEGMRSFVYYVAYCCDKKAAAKTRQEKERYNDFIELGSELAVKNAGKFHED